MQFSAQDLVKLFYGIFVLAISVSPLIAIIWLFAWLKDIRTDTRRILQVLRKRFPEDFPEE